ncbi:Tyrosine kinase receptor Cad96Ca [Pseudolycoriella hygida]|uniref:Tyrosine kinase receptor Cad96Ca n=1 Tax=Pseudolycoriella hygida TaxID=35572 RepID=A0A9Q0S115_9DIPT|nr:Tyrosine kinase receptor Cad96Ca [Pseudolycoriella hygida]
MVLPSPASSTRRLSTASSHQPPIDRNNKLMSVLAARRQALMKDRNRLYTTPYSPSSTTINSPNEKLSPRRECENNCTSNFTTRGSAGCMRKCAVLFKTDNNGTETSRRNIEALNSRIRVTEKEFNTIAEELLDTEESQSNGLYHVHPRNRYAPNVPETKDSANSTHNNRNNFKQSNVIENEVRQTSTEKVHTKFVRTTTDGRHKRTDPTLVKNRALSNEKLETSGESDILPYSIFGQKIATAKQNESKNLVTTSPRRLSIIESSVRPTSKLSDEEILEFSVSKVPAFERNKFRRFNPTHRNIVAMNRKIQNAQNSDYGISSTISRSRLPEGLVASNNSVDAKSQGSSVVENISSLNGTEEVGKNETIPSTTTLTPEILITASTSTTTTESPTTSTTTISSTSIATPMSTSTTTETEATTVTAATESIRNVRSSTVISVVETDENHALLIYVPDPSPTPVSTSETSERVTTIRSVQQPKTSTTSGNTSEKDLATTPATTLNLPDSMINPRINFHGDETPNLIVFFKPNTTELTVKSLPEDKDISSSTTKSFTRTTVSSSVRSTVNPIAKNHSSEDKLSFTTSSTEATFFSNINMSMVYQNLSDIFKPTKKSNSVSDGVFLNNNNDVTIEMHRMNMATYVLAALGMFPVLLIVLYVAKTIIFRRDGKTNCDLERYIISDSQKQISPVVKLDRSDHQIYSDESIMTEHSFNRNFLKFKNLLGEGNFGQVWKAEADDLAGHLGTTRIVAVKTERCVNGGLREEAAIMRKLGSHSNVVTLLGACVEKEPHLLIMEFAMRGRLLSLLRAAKTAVNNSHNGNMGPRSFAPLSPRRLTGFAHDIARGMEYISEKKIVHRDLATRNVLLDHNGVCKICDFGMSIDLEKTNQSNSRKIDLLRQQSSPESNRFRFDFHRRSFGLDRKTDHCVKRPALPIRWMAPEALQYHIFSTETDVWAFGIVLWEIASGGCTPYPNLSGREVVRNIPNGTRPEIPSDCRPELYELMARAWRKDPRQRPTFKDARNELARALCQWEVEDNTSDYLDVSGFSEDIEHGMVYFNRRISEFECEI